MAPRPKDCTYGLTAERLRSLIDYNPLTGAFTWKAPQSNRMKAGDVAGVKRAAGRRFIKVDGERYVAARLAWLYMTGEWPINFVDHRNLQPDDDRWENLRDATNSENGINRGLDRRNTSGLKGAFYCRARNNWQAAIRVAGRLVYLGRYPTVEQAHAAYAAAAQQHFGDFARAA